VITSGGTSGAVISVYGIILTYVIAVIYDSFRVAGEQAGPVGARETHPDASTKR
jgi:hypothetical protein